MSEDLDKFEECSYIDTLCKESYERGLKDGQATFLREAKNYVITEPEANTLDLISFLMQLLVIQEPPIAPPKGEE